MVASQKPSWFVHWLRHGRCWSVGLTLALALALALAPAASSQELTPQQVELLHSLDQQQIDQALEIAQQAAEWRQRLQADADAAAREELVRAIAQEAQALQARYPELTAPIDYASRIAPILRQADQAWRQAEYVAEEYEGFSEENFREEAKRRAWAEAAERLEEALGAGVLDQLESLRDPAAYAKRFAEGELQKWISQPVALGGDDSLQARIRPPPAGAPLFGPEAEYGAEIVYMDDLTVAATGIHVEYQPGQVPRINIDNMRAETNLKDMVLDNVAALGNEFSGQLDLPIKVTLNGQPEFAAASGGARGGISFDVQIGLLGGDSVQATAEDLVLYPGNRVDWKGGSLTVAVRTDSPVPIGTTPFGMWKIVGKMNPQTKEITIRTQISTMASPPEMVGLDVGLTTQMPIKSLKLDGHLIVGTLKFLQAEGLIDFEKGEIAGRFQSSEQGSPLAQLAFADGSFRLQRERFLADGQVELFGKSFTDMHCEIDFEDGSGQLYATGGFELFGADFASTLAAQIDPGFGRVRLEAMQSLTVAGVAPYGEIGVIVTVSADSDQPETVHVVAEAFGPGLKAEFDVPTLTGCTVAVLQKQLQKQAVASYHQLLKSLASGEEDVRKFGAKLDQKTRDYVDEKLGVTVDWGNEDLNRLGGDLSREFKNAGGAASDAREQIGGGLTDAREGVQGFGRRADEGAREFFGL